MKSLCKIVIRWRMLRWSCLAAVSACAAKVPKKKTMRTQPRVHVHKDTAVAANSDVSSCSRQTMCGPGAGELLDLGGERKHISLESGHLLALLVGLCLELSLLREQALQLRAHGAGQTGERR